MRRRHRFAGFQWLFLATVAVAGSLVARAGTIRHDRADQLYRGGTGDPALAAVAQLLVANSAHCSGTLIGPQWVLTAAHCILGRTSIFPQQTIVVAGQRIEIGPDDIFIHPEWVQGGFDVLSTRGDIALIRLPRAVRHVRPIPLHQRADEVGQEAFLAGFGSTGTGLTGNTVRTAVRRMGSNVVDATVATISFPAQFPYNRSVTVGSSRALLTDFDNPRRNSSTLGSHVPLNLEYTTAKGDSGGPLLLLQRDRSWTVAGVTSGGIDGFDGTSTASSFYSDTATYTRVVSYLTWVDTVMKGNAMNLTQYLAQLGDDSDDVMRAAARAHVEREAALRRKGWRLHTRAAVTAGSESNAQSAGKLLRPRDPMAEIIEEIRQGFTKRNPEPATAEHPGFDRGQHVSFEGCGCESGR